MQSCAFQCRVVLGWGVLDLALHPEFGSRFEWYQNPCDQEESVAVSTSNERGYDQHLSPVTSIDTVCFMDPPVGCVPVMARRGVLQIGQ